MNESVRIDCEVCADLYPLVEDGVACERSREAVFRHMENCTECRRKFGVPAEAGQVIGKSKDKDDARIIGRVRERVSGWLLAGIMVSLLLGVLLTSSETPYLILLIFPAICGGVYLRGGRLWKQVPLMAAVLWVIVTLLVSGGRMADLPMAFSLAVIPLGLSYLGALAAALMKYAIKGEF